MLTNTASCIAALLNYAGRYMCQAVQTINHWQSNTMRVIEETKNGELCVRKQPVIGVLPSLQGGL